MTIEFSIQAGGPTPCTRNNTLCIRNKMLLVNGKHQTRHKLHIYQLEVVATLDLLPPPICVMPIQSCNPFEINIVLYPAAHVRLAIPMAHFTHISPMDTSKGLHDMALGLRKDLHAFYVRATRGS